MSRLRLVGPGVLLTLIATLAGSAAWAETVSREAVPMLNLTLGEVGIFDELDEPLRFGVEYRFRSIGRWRLIPAVGAAAAENGAYFLYTDLRYDFYLSNRWLLIPSFGLGFFDDGDEIQLGHEMEFRSGLELAYRFHRQWRLGLAFFHLSNAGLSERNPGTESLVLSLCIPLSD